MNFALQGLGTSKIPSGFIRTAIIAIALAWAGTSFAQYPAHGPSSYDAYSGTDARPTSTANLAGEGVVSQDCDFPKPFPGGILNNTCTTYVVAAGATYSTGATFTGPCKAGSIATIVNAEDPTFPCNASITVQSNSESNPWDASSTILAAETFGGRSIFLQVNPATLAVSYIANSEWGPNSQIGGQPAGSKMTPHLFFGNWWSTPNTLASVDVTTCSTACVVNTIATLGTVSSEGKFPAAAPPIYSGGGWDTNETETIACTSTGALGEAQNTFRYSACVACAQSGVKLSACLSSGYQVAVGWYDVKLDACGSSGNWPGGWPSHMGGKVGLGAPGDYCVGFATGLDPTGSILGKACSAFEIENGSWKCIDTQGNTGGGVECSEGTLTGCPGIHANFVDAVGNDIATLEQNDIGRLRFKTGTAVAGPTNVTINGSGHPANAGTMEVVTGAETGNIYALSIADWTSVLINAPWFAGIQGDHLSGKAVCAAGSPTFNCGPVYVGMYYNVTGEPTSAGQNPSGAGNDEIITLELSSEPVAYRFMHTRNNAMLDCTTDKNGNCTTFNFNHQGVSGAPAPNGLLAEFASDNNGTLGIDSNGLYRTELVIVEMTPTATNPPIAPTGLTATVK